MPPKAAAFWNKTTKVHSKYVLFNKIRTSFLEWQNKYIVLVLYSAAKGGYACDCYLSCKVNMNLKTSFILEAVL